MEGIRRNPEMRTGNLIYHFDDGQERIVLNIDGLKQDLLECGIDGFKIQHVMDELRKAVEGVEYYKKHGKKLFGNLLTGVVSFMDSDMTRVHFFPDKTNRLLIKKIIERSCKKEK